MGSWLSSLIMIFKSTSYSAKRIIFNFEVYWNHFRKGAFTLYKQLLFILQCFQISFVIEALWNVSAQDMVVFCEPKIGTSEIFSRTSGFLKVTCPGLVANYYFCTALVSYDIYVMGLCHCQEGQLCDKHDYNTFL